MNAKNFNKTTVAAFAPSVGAIALVRAIVCHGSNEFLDDIGD